MTAEMVIKDTQVITMTRPTNTSDAQALAVDRGRIMAVGANQEMETLIGPGTQVLSLPGKAVLPGFFDTHAHFMCTRAGPAGAQRGRYDLHGRHPGQHRPGGQAERTG